MTMTTDIHLAPGTAPRAVVGVINDPASEYCGSHYATIVLGDLTIYLPGFGREAADCCVAIAHELLRAVTLVMQPAPSPPLASEDMPF